MNNAKDNTSTSGSHVIDLTDEEGRTRSTDVEPRIHGDNPPTDSDCGLEGRRENSGIDAARPAKKRNTGRTPRGSSKFFTCVECLGDYDWREHEVDGLCVACYEYWLMENASTDDDDSSCSSE